MVAALLLWPYIGSMVLRSSRGRPLNAPAAFIHPCQPIVIQSPVAASLLHDEPATPVLATMWRQMNGVSFVARNSIFYFYVK
jgi:hypothetical protein